MDLYLIAFFDFFYLCFYFCSSRSTSTFTLIGKNKSLLVETIHFLETFAKLLKRVVWLCKSISYFFGRRFDVVLFIITSSDIVLFKINSLGLIFRMLVIDKKKHTHLVQNEKQKNTHTIKIPSCNSPSSTTTTATSTTIQSTFSEDDFLIQAAASSSMVLLWFLWDEVATTSN